MTYTKVSTRRLMSRSRSVIAATLGAAILALSACVPTPTSESDSNSSDELEAFYQQELDFRGCMEFAQSESASQFFASETLECTYLNVPMDYSYPSDDRMQIAVLRVPAEDDPEERVGNRLR